MNSIEIMQLIFNSIGGIDYDINNRKYKAFAWLGDHEDIFTHLWNDDIPKSRTQRNFCELRIYSKMSDGEYGLIFKETCKAGEHYTDEQKEKTINDFVLHCLYGLLMAGIFHCKETTQELILNHYPNS